LSASGLPRCGWPCSVSIGYSLADLSLPVNLQGKPERDTAYAPILEALSTIYKDVPDAERYVNLG
jgi:hypothetical protein